MSRERLEALTLRDGTRLRCLEVTTAGARATVLLLSGRSEFIEKSREVAGELVARGLDVVTFDWRGQGLSTRTLPQRGFVPDFAAYVDDLDEVARARATGRGPLLVFAHSMGAHVSLRWLRERGHGGAAREVRGAVLTAPMLDLYTGGYPPALARRVVRAMVRLGCGAAYAPGMTDYRPEADVFAGNVLTRDSARFARRVALVRENPELTLGGPTARWLDAAFRSIELVSAPGYLEAIATPVLVCAPGADRVVPRAAMERAARRLPRGELVVFPGAYHELLHELDPVRRAFWSAFDRFAEPLLAPRPEARKR